VKPDAEVTSVPGVSRRRAIQVAGAGAVVVGTGAAVAAAASSADAAERTHGHGRGHRPKPPPEPCLALTAEQVEGPYYLDYNLVRRDITEDYPGVPLRLRLKVIDETTCRPLRGAAVDIWHCSAVGEYSGYDAMGGGGGPTGPPPTGTPTGPPPGGGGGGGHAEPTNDLTFLRGTQLTDRHGVVEFDTLFPGWYQGRAIHIHAKVKVDGELTDEGYEGGHQCHTGQFYFAEEAVLQIVGLDPYVTNPATRVLLDEDGIYPGGGVTGGLLDLRYREGRIERGVLGAITMSVDPAAVNTGSGAGPQPSASASASASPTAS
jgi:protocatechuate 3,4-dioxygenase beta subunit